MAEALGLNYFCLGFGEGQTTGRASSPLVPTSKRATNRFSGRFYHICHTSLFWLSFWFYMHRKQPLGGVLLWPLGRVLLPGELVFFLLVASIIAFLGQLANFSLGQHGDPESQSWVRQACHHRCLLVALGVDQSLEARQALCGRVGLARARCGYGATLVCSHRSGRLGPNVRPVGKQKNSRVNEW